MSATRVVCIKDTGQRVEFQTYDDTREAEGIAARLREIGCNAAVEPCEAREPGLDAHARAEKWALK
jgi:hypothetical protein